MNWLHIYLAGCAAVVITVVVGLIRKNNWISRGGAVVLTLAAIVIWNVADFYYIRNLSDQESARKLDTAIKSMPTYKLIEVHEPQVLVQIRTQVLAMIKEGKSEQQVIDVIQPQVLAIQRQRLQFASDALVVAVMQVNMEQTAAVQTVSDDACYRFLYPEVKGGINSVKMLSHDMLMKRVNTDVAMMQSSYGPNKHTVTNEELLNAKKDIQSVVQELMPKYGEDFAIMGDPRRGLGKEKIACEMVQDVWNNVIKLPENKAAGIIRMALAMENK